jgi:hypothetical protein
LENTEENCEMMGKVWKVSWIVKRFGKYRNKLWKWYEKYGRKVSWKVKRYEKYGKKASCMVKWYGKYGRFLC